MNSIESFFFECLNYFSTINTLYTSQLSENNNYHNLASYQHNKYYHPLPLSLINRSSKHISLPTYPLASLAISVSIALT